MKHKLQITIVTSAMSVVAFAALAQSTLNSKTDQPANTRKRTPDARVPDRLNDAAKATDIIGMTVNNYQDEKLGKVEDLAVDVESGRIVQVILSTGGLLGIGDRLTAVPAGALRHDAARKLLQLDADKEKLKSAPKFEMANWSEYSDSNHLWEVYRYYGQEPAFGFVQAGENVPSTDSTLKANGTPGQKNVSSANQSMIASSRLGQVQKASKLMGSSVKNLQDEKLGKVENLLVDLPSGRIVAVIISSGGFLGINDELSAVPPTTLRFAADRGNLQLDASKETLSSAPHFTANQWPDFAQPNYSSGIYRAYGLEPYFTTNITTQADNTARNVREREGRSLTPLDQGNSKADVDITARIRKEIMAANKLSVNAQNVKIVTRNGQVTLRGPVNTAEEKSRIGEIADRVARSGNVDNQLEVSPAPTGRN